MRALRYKKLTSLTAFMLCLVFLLSSCSGQKETGEITTQSEEPGNTEDEIVSLAVPYLADDSLNPFFMTTKTNTSLVSLVFGSLYVLDTSFTAVCSLAESDARTPGSIKVNLPEGLLFSDTSPVTAGDVVYSFELAKNSIVYSGTLSSIASCEALTDKTVMFTLTGDDAFAVNLLTFPIAKTGTAATADSLPVGCGPYVFTDDGIRTSLTLNTRYAGRQPSVHTIRLTAVSDPDICEQLVENGELDFCYSDLSSASLQRACSTAAYVYLNNLVYLGVNRYSSTLGVDAIRRGLFYALDRQSIVTNGYQSAARPACLPLNTSWAPVVSSAAASGLKLTSDAEKAKELFGLFEIDPETKPINLTLICPETNTYMRNTAAEIANELKPWGITVTIRYIGDSAYINEIYAGNYDLFIAEVKIPANMNLSSFFASGDASLGLTVSQSLSAEYFSFRSGESNIDDFITAFTDEVPFIPLLFRNGRFCYTPRLTSPMRVTEKSLFGDIPNWEFE